MFFEKKNEKEKKRHTLKENNEIIIIKNKKRKKDPKKILFFSQFTCNDDSPNPAQTITIKNRQTFPFFFLSLFRFSEGFGTQSYIVILVVKSLILSPQFSGINYYKHNTRNEREGGIF